MRTIKANGAPVTAFDLIVPTFFMLALLINAMLPELGMKQSSAACTLLLAMAGLIGLVRIRPVFSVSILYSLVIGLTAFVAGVGIESGGFLRETDIYGEANGAFSRLLPFYLIFVVCALFAFGRIVDERPAREPIYARMTQQPASVVLGLGLAAAIICTGVLAGLTGGFAILSGINRYALRNDSSDGVLFNLFLNNQTFVAVLLGTFSTSRHRGARWVAIFMIVVDLGLDALHGEQFMAVLDVSLSMLAPFIAIHAMNGKPVIRYLGMGAGVALLLGSVSVFYAYKGQGLDISDTVNSRFLLQGQVWYMVDSDAHMFSAPTLGGTPAFWRFVSSLGSRTTPTFFSDSDASGLREVMMSYGTPEILKDYILDDVTFTMGNMAVPVYWFGYVGGALFVAMTGAAYGSLSALQILLATRGGIVMLWLITKIFSYATYAVQQGEYWALFGSRTILYAMVALAWWYCVDARGSRPALRHMRLF